MDIFDYLIMAVGFILIVIGLVLFVSGKRESSNHSQVEGFGIKLNVTNPSIILIVFGIGLLLVPKLLPTQPDFQAGALSTDTQPRDMTRQPAQTETLAQAEPQTIEQVNSPPESVAAATWFPRGTWQLSTYELNGMDQSGMVEAEIHFVNPSAQTVAWNSQFVVTDGWGNFANYFYQGKIINQGNGYSIQINSSNDPNFISQSAVPLELKMDNNRQLHMAYFYSGSNLLLHWEQ